MASAFPTGVKDVFELRLGSGRTVTASANHPFLTVDGWLRLDELTIGSRIAVPRLIPQPKETQEWPEHEVVLLAHLIGDGCVAPRQPIHYTSADPACLEAVEAAARRFDIEPRRVEQGNWSHVYLPSPVKLARGRRNPIAAWLDQWGLYGRRSHEKFVPAAIFALSDDQVGLFLRHLWATDDASGGGAKVACMTCPRAVGWSTTCGSCCCGSDPVDSANGRRVARTPGLPTLHRRTLRAAGLPRTSGRRRQ